MSDVTQQFAIWWKRQQDAGNDAPTYEEAFQAGYQARDAEIAELVECLEWILPLAHQAIRNGIKHPQQSQWIRDAEEALAKHKQEG